MTGKAQKEYIAEGIGKVFEHRKNFLVIGLTGRTGSGCTTAARVLATALFSDLSLPSVQNPPRSHEDRKLRIVRLWAEKHWQPFATISVTALILAMAIREGNQKLVSHLLLIDSNISQAEIVKILRPIERKVKKAFAVLDRLHAADDQEILDAMHTLIVEVVARLSRLREILLPHKTAYTRFFQELGNNIRQSGSPFQNKVDPEKIFTIPAAIEKIIALFRKYCSIKGLDQRYVVVDALRHPYEIRYLRERISSFYTMAVSTTDDDRKRRLHDLQLTNEEIKDLDNREYPDRIADADDYSDLVKQNIKSCLELADVYISNTGSGSESRIELTRQLVRYVTLMQHPGLVTPTAVERCMQAAIAAKANSGCISRQVGAVVTDNSYSVKAIGWNDVPQGQVPCLLRNVSHLMQGGYDAVAYSEYERGDSEFKGILVKTYLSNSNFEAFDGRNLSFCFK
ncbi:hypothetical protein ACFQ3P_39720 [Paraburkholderia sabiae]|uniref:Uncharacterized protein n=1 Tax=Paraburkholderia sabiae TaxID=273251 RepID=A0ABU9QQX1_9BURK|nr:hypothetical protein [Paraburkholderia sabiae]WJZ74866.1 hypothetical protein QEN71_03355 [Paraburkholderia sabiae]CAD6562848.1 hypothetical protein LMG24235_08089 [Paraburkholderia sabiae]